jgi:hypothetical protein
MLFIETPIFTKRIRKGLTDDAYRELQAALVENPELGSDLGGGLYKVRWGVQERGKRGGVRVLYYWARAKGRILLLFLFAKNEQDDLTDEQKKAFRRLARQEFP